MGISGPASPVTVHCKGVLFDMDGILISSLGSVERTWTWWSRLRGIDPSQVLSIVHGCRAADTLARVAPELEPAVELKLIEDREVEDQEGVTALPGVLELIQALPVDRWTVVTSATRRLAKVRLSAAGIPVPKRFISGDDIAEGKPNPAPFLAGAALLGLPASDCVVFEDSISGTKAGRAAGCTVIATPFSQPAESLTFAHYLVSDLTRIAATKEGQSPISFHFEPLSSSH